MRRPRNRWPHTVAWTLLGVLVAGACNGDSEGGACGRITNEALDPAYLVHVLGDAEVEYLSDPPTSGPHQPAPEVEGVVDAPIPGPIQVGILERGDVLVQHDPDLGAAGRADLATLGGDGVVVAPNPDLPATVVATAWRAKQTCESVDVEALETFIEQRRGQGPEQE